MYQNDVSMSLANGCFLEATKDQAFNVALGIKARATTN